MIPTMPELFFIFFYIGLFTIGGGLVAITLMERILVGNGWITPDKFFNMVAISESTPGPVGINMATYIGHEFYGVWGGVITTFGEVLPSLICIIIIARLFAKFQEKPVVKTAFSVLRPCTAGIILVACAQVFRLALMNVPEVWSFDVQQFISLFRWKTVVFYLAALGILFKTKLHPVFVVLLGAVFGMIFL